MKPPKDKAKDKDKKDTADYLVNIGGLSRGEANQLAKITDKDATNQDVAESVTKGIK